MTPSEPLALKTRAALCRLTVLGEEFSAAQLDSSGLADAAAVDEAVSLGILAIDDDVIRFADAALRDQLRDELEAAPATALQARIRVARQAYQRLDYVEAVSHYRAALRLQPRAQGIEKRGRLLVELARAQFRAGGIEESWRSCEEAASWGRAHEDGQVMADAATVIRGAGPGSWSFSAQQHALCTEALRSLDGSEDLARQTRLRAQLGSLANPWARELPPSVSARSPANDSTDPESRFLELQAQQIQWANAEHAEQRLGLADEAMSLGAVSGVDEYLAWGVLWRLDALYQLCRRVELQAELMTATAICARLREPLWDWRLLNVRSSLAILDGDYDDADRLAVEAYKLGSGLGLEEARFVHLITASRLAVLTGVGLVDAEAEVRRAIEGAPFFARGWLAQVVAAMGRTEEVATIWRALAPHLAELPRHSPEWLVAQAGHAHLCVLLGDRATGRQLYELLLPYEHLYVVGGAQTPPYAPVALHLGRLARLLGDSAAARRHLQTASRISDAMHAEPAGVEARAELASLGRDGGPLSAREYEVAELVAEGLANRQISQRLHLSERTVESHVSSALRKLDLTSRAAIAAWFTRRT